MFEMPGLTVLSLTVGLYQVQVDGFAWLNQCDHPCNTALTLQKLQTGTHHQLGFYEQQQVALKAERTQENR